MTLLQRSNGDTVVFGAPTTGDVNKPMMLLASASDSGVILPRSTCFAVHRNFLRLSRVEWQIRVFLSSPCTVFLECFHSSSMSPTAILS